MSVPESDKDHVLTKRGERRVFMFIAVFPDLDDAADLRPARFELSHGSGGQYFATQSATGQGDVYTAAIAPPWRDIELC